MGEDTVMIYFSWDSGPYGLYGESDCEQPKIDVPGGYGDNDVPIPRPIWEAYSVAREALDEAEAALNDAMSAYVVEARKTDPRWAAELAARAAK